MSGKARRCSGCGHIETKNTDGGFRCASCGSTSYTLYVPPEEGNPALVPAGSYERPQFKRVEYERGKNECARCGASLTDPEESAYCDKCEKYLDLD